MLLIHSTLSQTDSGKVFSHPTQVVTYKLKKEISLSNFVLENPQKIYPPLKFPVMTNKNISLIYPFFDCYELLIQLQQKFNVKLLSSLLPFKSTSVACYMGS